MVGVGSKQKKKTVMSRRREPNHQILSGNNVLRVSGVAMRSWPVPCCKSTTVFSHPWMCSIILRRLCCLFVRQPCHADALVSARARASPYRKPWLLQSRMSLSSHSVVAPSTCCTSCALSGAIITRWWLAGRRISETFRLAETEIRGEELPGIGEELVVIAWLAHLVHDVHLAHA